MSNETFKVGEIAILCNCTISQHEGLEVTVISPLVLEDMRMRGLRWVYKLDIIEASSGINYHAEPHQLRKRRPPQDWVKLCNLNEVPDDCYDARKHEAAYP